MPINTATNREAFGTLRRMMQPQAPSAEKCELCSAPLVHEHEHLLQSDNRRLLCVCQACAVLFSDPQGTRFRRVPRLAVSLDYFQMTDVQWESLLIPINLAFFVLNSSTGRMVAIYPSPAGATESLLEFDTWQELAEANPRLHDMQPDVEALLINRAGTAHEYYLVSIDRCYELVGLMRLHWKGFSGGNKVWKEIGRFFEALKCVAGEFVRYT